MTTNHTQSSSEELSKKLAWWLSKLQIETVKNHRPVMITREDEEALEKCISGVEKFFASHLQAYTDEIRREVIGENETVNDIENPSWDDMRRQTAALGKNQLKALQHKALNNLASKWSIK